MSSLTPLSRGSLDTSTSCQSDDDLRSSTASMGNSNGGISNLDGSDNGDALDFVKESKYSPPRAILTEEYHQKFKKIERIFRKVVYQLSLFKEEISFLITMSNLFPQHVINQVNEFVIGYQDFQGNHAKYLCEKERLIFVLQKLISFIPQLPEAQLQEEANKVVYENQFDSIEEFQTHVEHLRNAAVGYDTQRAEINFMAKRIETFTKEIGLHIQNFEGKKKSIQEAASKQQAFANEQLEAVARVINMTETNQDDLEKIIQSSLSVFFAKQLKLEPEDLSDPNLSSSSATVVQVNHGAKSDPDLLLFNAQAFYKLFNQKSLKLTKWFEKMHALNQTKEDHMSNPQKNGAAQNRLKPKIEKLDAEIRASQIECKDKIANLEQIINITRNRLSDVSLAISFQLKQNSQEDIKLQEDIELAEEKRGKRFTEASRLVFYLNELSKVISSKLLLVNKEFKELPHPPAKGWKFWPWNSKVP